MPLTPKNVVIHELIGLRVRVIHHPDPTLIGFTGMVEDETLNTLVISSRTVSKRGAIFLFEIKKGKWVPVKGEEIMFRPWERTKRGYKKFLRRKVRSKEAIKT